MANKPGRAWNFPDFGNDAEKLALAKVRIGWLETENQKLVARIEQLENDFVEQRREVPEEILDAYVVEDLDNV